MEIVFIILIIVLFVLAFSDLIVGVSNDAVNFLNSAVGSRAAPLRTILIVAAAGVLVGATMSSGMMEIARKGIFHPEMFYFREILMLFLAVMITDVILLDTFNTFGLPTSTTVSIVFELLGAAVGISSLKLLAADKGLNELGNYINTEKAMMIIFGILLSVFIAFTVGAIIQYFARLAFTFHYKRNLKYTGAVWGGFAITAITYFILIKGAKSAAFMTADVKEFIMHNTWGIIAASFVAWTVIMQLLHSLFKVNILKLIVMVGTFALAMAFAGNDLVNFIGVPIAGLKAYQIFSGSPGADPETFPMTQLQGDVDTPTLILLLSGVVMMVTLWTSKKARSVIKTTVDLSRQDEGSERFGSTYLSRVIVRSARKISSQIGSVVPAALKSGVDKRFKPAPPQEKDDPSIKGLVPVASFDMIRASVTLVVASILIAMGTSLKLPLSTTYVTFMVAMGTSLSDRAWGRESAVYRITGVFSVIGGWFLTALAAFTVSLIMAVIFYMGGFIAVIAMSLLAIFIVYRTYRHHKARQAAQKAESDEVKSMREVARKTIRKNTEAVYDLYTRTFKALFNEDNNKLWKISKRARKADAAIKAVRDNVHQTIRALKSENVQNAHYYVQVCDYLREIAHNLSYIVQPAFEHVDNNHKPLIAVQQEELNELLKRIDGFHDQMMNMITQNNYTDFDELIRNEIKINNYIESLRVNQIKRIKNSQVGTKNSVLFLALLNESKNMLLNAGNMMKSMRDFENRDNEV